MANDLAASRLAMEQPAQPIACVVPAGCAVESAQLQVQLLLTLHVKGSTVAMSVLQAGGHVQ